jgi:thymidylate synthase (FAD)
MKLGSYSLLVEEEKMAKSIDIYGDGIGRVELVDFMGSDLTIVNSARVSFGKHKDSIDDRDKKLISYLVKNKHTSTLEHNVVTFRFCVPIFVRSQHHRHRTWSYNEISRRYTDINIRFYEPESFRTQHDSNRQASTDEHINPLISYPRFQYSADTASGAVKTHGEVSLKLYDRLVEAGVCREQARGVLPQNMYTEYYGTTNLNNLLKFIDLRIHSGAQWEIQQVAKACLDIAKELWPISVDTYRRIKSTNE